MGCGQDWTAYLLSGVLSIDGWNNRTALWACMRLHIENVFLSVDASCESNAGTQGLSAAPTSLRVRGFKFLSFYVNLTSFCSKMQ